MQKCSGWKDEALPNSTSAAWQWGSTSRCRNRGGSPIVSWQNYCITTAAIWTPLAAARGYVCLTMAWPRRNGGHRNTENPGKAKPRPGILAKKYFCVKILTQQLYHVILCLDFERRIEFVRVFQSNLPTDRPTGAGRDTDIWDVGLPAYGHTDSRVHCRSAIWIALLIELKAQIL